MSDIDSETLITLLAATRLKWLPRKREGKRPHFSTFFRYATKGIGGIKLETRRVGACLCTSEPALRRFFARLSDPAAKPEQIDVAGGHAMAEKSLAAAGI